VALHLRTAYTQQQHHGVDSPAKANVPSVSSSKIRRSEVTRVLEAVKSLALCHNVTPTYEGGDRIGGSSDDTEADQHSNQQVVYQASSPDEVIPMLFFSIKIYCAANNFFQI
jgi:phospholipid-translocating ATPase